MKRLLVILALFLAACTLLTPKQTPADTLSNRIRYICNSGRPIDVTYQKDRILLRYKEKNHLLGVAISVGSARYAGDGLIWWNKGTENRLYKLLGKEGTGELLENCREISDKRK